MDRRRGFTLIELLVVISIIALLMAILVPALNRAKREAKTAICLSNLHQWGLAWKMYTDENAGYFVRNLGWVEPLEPFFVNRKLLFCPEAKKLAIDGAKDPFAAWGAPLPEFAGSYGMNYWITKEPSAATTRDDLMWKTPSARGAAYAPVLTGCSLGGACVHHEDDPPRFDGDAFPSGAGGNLHEMRRFCMNRHTGYVNSLFMDWHARKVGLKELWELHWHRKWNPSHAPPPVWPPWMKNFKDYVF